MFSSDFWPPRVVTGGVTTISVGVILPSATVILTVDGSISAEFHSSSWRREAKYTMFCHNRRRQWFRLWRVIDPAPQWTWIIPQPAGTVHHACFLHNQPFSCTHRKIKAPIGTFYAWMLWKNSFLPQPQVIMGILRFYPEPNVVLLTVSITKPFFPHKTLFAQLF